MPEALINPSGALPPSTGNTRIWLDEKARPHNYTELDWVRALSLLHPVAELANPKGDEVMVDVGTGTGAVLNHLAPYVRQAIGVDVSDAMLSRVELADPRVSVVRGDVTDRLPFPDNCADLVTARMMLHDLEDPIAAVGELWRLVRPGGRLIAVEFVTDICSPEAVEQTDAFENDERDTSLLSGELFTEPSAELAAFHRYLFELKQEPNRFLWTAQDFKSLFLSVNGTVASADIHHSVALRNSVANWLGKSGFGLEVKQQGLQAYLLAPPELQDEMGAITTLNEKPLNGGQQAEWANYYAHATPETREKFGIDVKIHRAFANIVLQKAG